MEEPSTRKANLYNQETDITSDFFPTSSSGKGTNNELSTSLGKVMYETQ